VRLWRSTSPLSSSRPVARGEGGTLQLQEITVNFGGLRALDDVSLEVNPGQIMGVIGPNGAGKTTLFNVACGFVQPDHGWIRFAGRELAGLKPHQLAPLGIARTLQGVGLFDRMTIAENVMAGGHISARVDLLSAMAGIGRSSRSERALRARAMALLERLGVAEHADTLPTVLPYAIQKRASLARALMEEPTVLLLDEPASGLSAAEMEDLKSLMFELRKDMAILLVEHHMDLVMAVCDQLVVLNFGRVIASGSPDEVKANPEVTRAYLGEEVSADAPD
jgi:branched-chain amino acid transport system ATP-binding protein